MPQADNDTPRQPDDAMGAAGPPVWLPRVPSPTPADDDMMDAEPDEQPEEMMDLSDPKCLPADDEQWSISTKSKLPSGDLGKGCQARRRCQCAAPRKHEERRAYRCHAGCVGHASKGAPPLARIPASRLRNCTCRIDGPALPDRNDARSTAAGEPRAAGRSVGPTPRGTSLHEMMSERLRNDRGLPFLTGPMRFWSRCRIFKKFSRLPCPPCPPCPPSTSATPAADASDMPLDTFANLSLTPKTETGPEGPTPGAGSGSKASE